MSKKLKKSLYSMLLMLLVLSITITAGEAVSVHPYDKDSNWIIDDFELLAAIDEWAKDSLGDFELLGIVDFWADECYEWDAGSEQHVKCAERYNSIDYVPMQSGNTWVFNSGVVNTPGETHTFTAGTGTRFNNMGGFCMDHDIFMADSPNGIVIYGVYEDGAYQDFNDSFIILPKSLKVNDSWSIIGPDFNVQLTFVGLDTVTVPAGTFADTLKIKIDVEDYDGSDGTYITYFWYAKNVGLIKAERTTESPQGHDGCWMVTSENPLNELQSAVVNGIPYLRNEPPVFSIVNSASFSYRRDFYGRLMGATAYITQEAIDPEGDQLSYSWELTDGCGSISSGADTSTVAVNMCLSRGDLMPFDVTVTVTDEGGNIIKKTVRIR